MVWYTVVFFDSPLHFNTRLINDFIKWAFEQFIYLFYHGGNIWVYWLFVTVPNMANPKEKTPMCLVNELARFNKIQPEYKLLCEQGPAHSKVPGESVQSHNIVYVSEILNSLPFVPLLPSSAPSDFLCSTHTGRPVLGSRGTQHQESPAFCGRICPCRDNTS